MMGAVLAIWNDCKPGREAVYEAWYREEHLIERLRVPGFHVGRRYIALDGAPEYLTSYEVSSTEVLRSTAYQGCLANPTARTRDIMQDGFEKMSRTVCTRTQVVGAIRGAFVVTAAHPDQSDLSSLLDTVPSPQDILHSELWVSAETRDTARSQEEALRGPDQKIASCLLLEFASKAASRTACDALRHAAPTATIGLYQKICELRESDLT